MGEICIARMHSRFGLGFRLWVAAAPTTPLDSIMAQKQPCPTCGIPIPPTASAFCTACGNPLPRQFLDERAAVLTRIADRQRDLIWLVLVNILIQIGVWVVPLPPWPFMGWVILGVMALLFLGNIVFIVRLINAQGTHVVVQILVALLALAPLVNLLVMLMANSQATATLRAAGIKIGFLGATKRNVKMAVSIGRCRQCDYDLTGLTAGRCPECGLIFNAASAAAVGAAPPKIG